MGLLPDTQNCGLRMGRECRERFPRHRLQRIPLDNDPGMHHGMCVAHVPWCMSGSLTRGGGENVPGIPGATRNCAYLVRGLCDDDLYSTDELYKLYITVQYVVLSTELRWATVTLASWHILDRKLPSHQNSINAVIFRALSNTRKLTFNFTLYISA